MENIKAKKELDSCIEEVRSVLKHTLCTDCKGKLQNVEHSEKPSTLKMQASQDQTIKKNKKAPAITVSSGGAFKMIMSIAALAVVACIAGITLSPQSSNTIMLANVAHSANKDGLAGESQLRFLSSEPLNCENDDCIQPYGQNNFDMIKTPDDLSEKELANLIHELQNSWKDRLSDSPKIDDNNILVVPMFSREDAGCLSSNKRTLKFMNKIQNDQLSNPIIQIEEDYTKGGVMRIKDILESAKETVPKVYTMQESIPNINPTGTELMPVSAIHEFENSNENINTMYCESPTMMLNKMLVNPKTDCNQLQILVPMDHLKTLVNGDDSIVNDSIFSGQGHDDNFMVEILCDIKQINKVFSPSITKLFTVSV